MREEDVYSWGLSVGRFAGLRVRLHWSLLILGVVELNRLLQLGVGRQVLGIWLATTVVGFFIIFLHELGHCFTARAVGGSADEVLLWPLGGLAMCACPRLWHAHFLLAAGGPAVNVAIAALAYGVFFFLPPSNNVYLIVLRGTLQDWNLFLLVFNLIPLYPLDGGRMFHSLLWGFFRRRGGGGHVPWAYGKASLVTVWVSRITAAVGLLYAVYVMSFWLALIFFWALSGTQNLYRRIHVDEEDFSFGYDFSRGYTSLGGADSARRRERRREKRRGFWSWLRGGRSARRQAGAPESEGHAPGDPRRDEERQRVDQLLEKISREGMTSLTRAERRFLEKTSKRWSRD